MKWPRWTLLLCVLATVIFFLPSIGSALIYDRELIQSGEWWRLVTGNLVHLSDRHFIFNVLGLLGVGAIIELRGERYLWCIYLAAAAVIGLVVYITAPELRFFGGLSGIVSAGLVYLCVSGLRDPGAWRWLCSILLLCVVAKIGMEFIAGDLFFLAIEPQTFTPVPASHLAGACTALLAHRLPRMAE